MSEETAVLSLAEHKKKRRKPAVATALPDGFAWPKLKPNGEPAPYSRLNVAAYLEHVGVSVSYNEMARRHFVTRGGQTTPLTDRIADDLWLDACEKGLQASETFFYKALTSIGYETEFHPVRDYLDSLDWDGIPRLDEWLHAFFGAENTPLNSAYGRKHMIAAVRRIRQPGAKHDAMLVLQGPQGCGKSSGIAALCPDESWFSDSLTIGDDQKQIIELTTGKWIVELAEMDGMSKRDASTIKSMLSRRVDTSRLAYARMVSEQPRQFVLWGTVNEAQYLRDATGNRRFWAVSISGAPNPHEVAENIRRNRDQLWAEAAYYERQGESTSLPQELWDVAATAQDERVMVDPWEDRLASEAGLWEMAAEQRNLADGGEEQRTFVASDTVYECLGVVTEKRNTGTSQRISAIMARLGFERRQRRKGPGQRVWGYERARPLVVPPPEPGAPDEAASAAT